MSGNAARRAPHRDHRANPKRIRRNRAGVCHALRPAAVSRGLVQQESCDGCASPNSPGWAFCLAHGSSRIDAASSLSNRSILDFSAERRATTADVRQLPKPIRITFGGAPRKIESSTKSSSFVTKKNPFSAATRQMTISSAPTRPTSRMCAEDGKRLATCFGRSAERFSSKSSLTQRAMRRCADHAPPRMRSTRECPRA